MSSTGFFKRSIPFLAAFSLGIFIASFFVTIGGPGFRGHSRGGCEKRQFRVEMERLRRENSQLRDQLEEMRTNSENRDLDGIPILTDDPVTFDAPVPPPPPVSGLRHNHR